MLGRLHVLVDPLTVGGLTLAQAALDAGTPVLQVRITAGADLERYRASEQMVHLCDKAKAQCIVNDRVDIAAALGTGVHLGATDLPVVVARHVLGPRATIGGTARDAPTAQRLVNEGATYVGVGPAFATSTKIGLPEPLGPQRVGIVATSVDAPVIAIGGITHDRVGELVRHGVHGVAVISAVTCAVDPAQACRRLLDALGETS